MSSGRGDIRGDAVIGLRPRTGAITDYYVPAEPPSLSIGALIPGFRRDGGGDDASSSAVDSGCDGDDDHDDDDDHDELTVENGGVDVATAPEVHFPLGTSACGGAMDVLNRHLMSQAGNFLLEQAIDIGMCGSNEGCSPTALATLSCVLWRGTNDEELRRELESGVLCGICDDSGGKACDGVLDLCLSLGVENATHAHGALLRVCVMSSAAPRQEFVMGLSNLALPVDLVRGEPSAAALNAWCYRATQGRVRGLLPADSHFDKDRVALGAVMSVDGTWTEGFEDCGLKRFRTMDAIADSWVGDLVPFMTTTRVLPYYASERCEFVGVPMKNGCTFVLCRDYVDGATYEEVLSEFLDGYVRVLGHGWHDADSRTWTSTRLETVELTMPKFRVSERYELLDESMAFRVLQGARLGRGLVRGGDKAAEAPEVPDVPEVPEVDFALHAVECVFDVGGAKECGGAAGACKGADVRAVAATQPFFWAVAGWSKALLLAGFMADAKRASV